MLVRLYLGCEPWEVFTESEKYLIRKTERRFRAALREAGFLPEQGAEDLLRAAVNDS